MTSPSPYDRVATGYRIVGRIRRGPDATLYQAVRESDNTAVALKVLRTDAHIDTELSHVRRLPHHPHIVRVLDTGRTLDGRPYLAMEYCPDGSYGDLLADTAAVSVDEASRVGIAIAEALQATHDIGLVHRDVTPENILRGPNGPALTDFGIATVPGELAGTVALDRLTPPHASPEALTRRPQDARSDVYSLGSTLWTLVAGYPPFATAGDTSPDPFEYRERVLREPVPDLPGEGIPDWLQGTLHKAMAKDPDQRYHSAAALATALRGRDEPWTSRSPQSEGEPLVAPSTVSRSDALAKPAAESSGPVEARAPEPDVVVWPAEEVVEPVPADSTQPAWEPSPYEPPTVVPAPDLFGESSPPAPVAELGWWAPEDSVLPGPPEQYFPEETTSRPRSGRRVFVTSAVLAVLAVVGLGVVLVTPLIRRGLDDAQPPAQQAAPSPVATPSDVPGIAPRDLHLSDERIAVTLSWRDPTNGEAVFYVVGTAAGGAPSTVANAARGKTSVRVNGLNPTVDYCFVVVAALSVDQVANADEICTTRFTAPTSAPAASPSATASPGPTPSA